MPRLRGVMQAYLSSFSNPFLLLPPNLLSPSRIENLSPIPVGPTGYCFSVVKMRLLLVSSAALLAFGCSVFGRPQNTQQEKRNLPSFTYDIASTLLSDSNAPDTVTYPAKIEDLTNAKTNANTSPELKSDGQPNFVTLDTSLKNTLTDTSDIASTFSSNSVTRPIDFTSIFNNPGSSSEMPSANPSSPDASDISRFLSSKAPITGTLLSEGLPDSGQDLPARVPEVPDDFEYWLQDIYNQHLRYYMFELTESKTGIDFPVNSGIGSEYHTWGGFMRGFLRLKPGFALYRKDDTTVLSIMNLARPCGVKYDEQTDEQAKDCPDERILKSFESAWTQKVFKYFKHVLSFDSIHDRNTLQGICVGNLKGLTPIDKDNPYFVECVS